MEGRKTVPNLSTNVFKASMGCCKRICQNGIVMRLHTELAQWLPKEYHETLQSFQCHIIRLREEHAYSLHLIGNAHQTPAFYEIAFNVIVNKQGDKSVILRTRENEKSGMTVMLRVLADREENSPMYNLNRKTMPKERYHLGSS